MISLTDDEVRQLRLHAQRLARPQETTVACLVKELGGIQAQDPRAATLAIRVRSIDLQATDVEDTLLQERSIVRTWGPRGTLHLLATEDLSWLLPLLGPVFIAKDRRRREELGLDEDTCRRGIQMIRQVLASQGPLTRDELVERIAIGGLQLVGQARPHLLSRAALEGVICFGPNRNGEPTYVLLGDWIAQENKGHMLSESEAHLELTHRYLGAYGPATPHDQASWSGLSIGQTRAAWQRMADQLLEVEVSHTPAWILKKDASRLQELPGSTPVVRLLPGFDVYLLGYQKRTLVVSPQNAHRINAGGGMVHPTVLVNGFVAGTWKTKRLKNHLKINVEPFAPLSPEVCTALENEVSDLGRFLATTVLWPAHKTTTEKPGGQF